MGASVFRQSLPQSAAFSIVSQEMMLNVVIVSRRTALYISTHTENPSTPAFDN
ncbi:hypothetical protein LCL98_16645 [Rossellomorea aquimaris]|nr:hypothetical protein [Rossellomorea aquimaris]